MSISRLFPPLMANTSKSRTAKQGINYASMASGATSKTGSNSTSSTSAPSLATDAMAGLQATLEKTMQEMAQVSGILKELQEDVSQVKRVQAKTSMDITAIYERMDEADSRIMDLETENARLATELQKRAKHCEELERVMQNAENKDRQLNLRLVGLKENEGEHLRELARQLIDDVLGVKLAENELQRVYRPGPFQTDEESPPRPVVMRFHSLLERDRVMAAAKGKYKSKTTLKWEEAKISIFPDATKAVAEKRRKFTDVRKKLHAMDIRFTLAYPAKLFFTWKGKKMTFEDHKKALQFLNKETEGLE